MTPRWITARVAVASTVGIAVLLTPTLEATMGSAPASARVSQQPPDVDASESPVVVRVATLLPRSPRPGDHLQISGTLSNQGRTPVGDLRVRLRLGSVIDTRGELLLADREEPATRPRSRTQTTPARTELRPGQSTAFEIRTTVDALTMTALGVYPLEVEVRGVVDAESRLTRVGRAATYLPWFGDQRVRPTRVAWLWPVVDTPRRGPREVMLDDELAWSLAPGGRLDRLLRSARAGESGACAPEPRPPDGVPQRPRPSERERCEPVPVTYAVDPDLLYTVGAMTRDYNVQTGEQQTPRPAAPAATGWLTSLGEAVRRSALIALPYADPDVVAVAEGPGGLRSELADARRVGADLARETLGTQPLPGVAWPPAGQLSDPALEALLDNGPSHVVLDEVALTGGDEVRSRTPGTRVELPTTTPATGLVLESRLSGLLAADPDGSQGPRLAEQRFLAETALISADRPNESRTLLVAPPRRAELDPSLAAQALLDTGRVPWLCPVALAEVIARQERCAGELGQPSYAPEPWGTLQPPDATTPMLSTGHVAEVAALRGQSTQFTDAVLKPGTRDAAATRARLQRGVLRTLSSAWREDEGRGRRLSRLLRDDIADLTGKVRVLTGQGPILFTSDRGRLRVALQNELGQPVVVRVRIDAANNARLTSDSSQLREIPAETSVQVDVPAQVLTSGQFRVQAQLLDRDGVAVGEPAVLVVRSTRYGTVALAVTGVATAVLLVAAGVRIARRALHRPGPDTEPDPDAGLDTGPDVGGAEPESAGGPDVGRARPDRAPTA